MNYSKFDFFGGINQQFDAHLADFEKEYYLGINVRARRNTLAPVRAPLDVTDGLPVSGNIQGLFSFDDYLLVFKGGEAYYRLVSDNVWAKVANLSLNPTVEYIEACLVPASTINLKRRAQSSDDYRPQPEYFSAAATTPECVFVTDGISQPWIILPDGSARITKTYAQWTPDDPEYVPVCKHPSYVNGILYVTGKDARGRFNQIFRSVPGRPLDFVILLDTSGDKIDSSESIGGAPALAHRVSFGEMTALQALPAQQGGLFASTSRASWLVQPDFDNTIAGAPTFINIPLFNVGAVGQYSIVDILGDTAIVHYDGIRSFNGISTQQNEGRNAAFNIKINRLIENIKQQSVATIEFDNYVFFALDTIYGPGVLVYDQTMQQFVSLDRYDNVGRIKQFAVVTTPNNFKLFFYDDNNRLYEAFAGAVQKAAVYLPELNPASANSQHRITTVTAVFGNRRVAGAAQATVYSDRTYNGIAVSHVAASDAPDIETAFPFSLTRAGSNAGVAHFNFSATAALGHHCGALIEWDADADLQAVFISTEEPAVPNPAPHLEEDTEYPIERVCILGSDGVDNANRDAVQSAIYKERPDFVIGTGNHAYEDGTAQEVADYMAAYWTIFRDQTRFAAVCSGRDNNTNNGEFVHAFVRGTPPRYFSHVVGDAEFFFFHSGYNEAGTQVEPDNLTGSDLSNSLQGVWLQAALANSTAKHKIVVIGHPPRSSAASFEGGAGILTAIRAIPFRAWGVDAVLGGNVQHYERLVDDRDLLMLNVGTGGQTLQDFGTIDAYSQVRIKQFGYVLATITPLHVLFEFKNVNGEVLDRVQI